MKPSIVLTLGVGVVGTPIMGSFVTGIVIWLIMAARG